jgi:hypothetical protein
VVCTISYCIFFFIFYQLRNALALVILPFFISFLCMQERQRAPSLAISPLRGDGDATATGISGGDIPISDAC